MRLFGNFKSKRELREEVFRLKEILKFRQYADKMRPKTQKVGASIITASDDRAPDEFFRAEIARKIIKELIPYIEYEVIDNGFNKKIYKGTLEVKIRD